MTGATGTGNITINVPASGVGTRWLADHSDRPIGNGRGRHPPRSCSITSHRRSPRPPERCPAGYGDHQPDGLRHHLLRSGNRVHGVRSRSDRQGVGGCGSHRHEKADANGLAYNVSLANLSEARTINVAIAAGAAIDTTGNNGAAFASTPVINFPTPAIQPWVRGQQRRRFVSAVFRCGRNVCHSNRDLPVRSDFTGGVRVASVDNGDGTIRYHRRFGDRSPGRNSRVAMTDSRRNCSGATGSSRRPSTPRSVRLGRRLQQRRRSDVISSSPDAVVRPRDDLRRQDVPFDGRGQSDADHNFFAVPDDTNFRGGARSATGDINADGKTDLVIGARTGGGPRVSTFNRATTGAMVVPACSAMLRVLSERFQHATKRCVRGRGGQRRRIRRHRNGLPGTAADPASDL